MEDIPHGRLYRFLEILPGTISWFILIAPVALSPVFPKMVAIFMLFYVTLWFLRSLKFNLYLLHSTYKSRARERMDWNGMLEKIPGSGEILHIVILATYNESVDLLRDSIRALVNVNFPTKRIFFVLAMEECHPDGQRTMETLQNEFAGTFRGFFCFVHPANLPHEVVGKGSNIRHAGEKMAQEIVRQNIDPAKVLVTTLDADNRVHPQYFSVLTHAYLTTKDRKHKSYQPLPLFYNNIWEVPMFNRLVGLSSSFWHLAQASQTYNIRNFSSHSQSLDALLETKFWSNQTIDEDGHQYWRSYFAFLGNHEVIPLFIPIYQDAVQNQTYFSTLKGQYVQLRRWAWGVTDIPYVILKMWKERKNLPLLKSVTVLFQLAEAHIMWATAPIVITLTNSVPQMLNREFSRTVFAYNLSQILSVYFTIALIGIVISLWVSLLTLPKHPAGLKWRLISMIQWVFLPIITILYGALPAIDAQTRLLLGKYLHFQVTEKYRKPEPVKIS